MATDASDTRADDGLQADAVGNGNVVGDETRSTLVTAGGELVARMAAAYGEDAVPRVLEYAAQRLSQTASPETADQEIAALRAALQGKTSEEIQRDPALLRRLGELLLGSTVNTLIVGVGNVVGDHSSSVVIQLTADLLDHLEEKCGDKAVVRLSEIIRELSGLPGAPSEARKEGAALEQELQGKAPSEVREDKPLLERLGKFLLMFVSAIADIYALVQLWSDLPAWIAKRSVPPAEAAPGALPEGARSGPSPSGSKPKPRDPEEPKARFELVLVRAGWFLMGSDPRKDPRAWKDEQPQHRLYLPHYQISKTPVTNEQYFAFVYRSKHRAPEHWNNGKPAEKILYHPVTHVSWHDAVAYCRWLAEVTGKPYRLPTEAEWEKAARGTEGWTYPWGNDWDPERCNCCDTVRTTTPVGAYSKRGGDSPYGCVDMAGNVWEWTSSIYKSYRYRADDGREDLKAGDDVRRVLRGGAFYLFQYHTRCASRGGSYPDFRLGGRGFRVAVSPSAAKRPSSAL